MNDIDSKATLCGQSGCPPVYVTFDGGGCSTLQDTPPEEVADILDTGQQVWLEGVVDSREEKEKFDTVYYKECAS